MVVLSAILSLALIALIYNTSKRERSRFLIPLLLATAGVVGGYYVDLWPFFLHAALVLLALVVWKSHQGSPRVLLAYLIVAAALPYGLIAYLTIDYGAEQHRLKKQYAFESMEARLPAPKPRAGTKISRETEEHLKSLDKNVGYETNDFRTLMLERLHRDSVQSFIDSPGFGVGRRILPTETTLKVNLDRRAEPIFQPDPVPSSSIAESDLHEPKDVKVDPLRDLHLSSVVDFAYPRGFGLIVSRQKVAGFIPHQFSMVPSAEHWKVRTLELVSLLIHDDPVVYVSDELPRMDKMRGGKTRSLNTFEDAGLKRLQEGDDLFLRETNEDIRMLGAVRSIDQCVRCHGGERGDLLGAFTYHLRRVP
jgi:hypothetical protein